MLGGEKCGGGGGGGWGGNWDDSLAHRWEIR